MDGIAYRALVVWGISHQLRLPSNGEASRTRRQEYAKSHLIRERDALIEAFSKYQPSAKGKPVLTPISENRVRRIREEYKALIEHEKGCGYHLGPCRNDMYPRPAGAPDRYPKGPNTSRVDSIQAVTFQIVECYLSPRPMQHALAWHRFVAGRGVGSFRYYEGEESKRVMICSSRTAAFRVQRDMMDRIAMIFATTFERPIPPAVLFPAMAAS